MSTFPEPAPAGNTRRSALAVTVWADPTEYARAELPPKSAAPFLVRPWLLLPGGVRVCVDGASPDAAAASWFDRMAVEATYAALWLKDRNQAGPR
ncbi:energy transducer TonB [Frankia sp. Cr1]|uniref:energy transducer TonB n=1 Tax=Frankia sp. Cr1 TaxID=3073931 RepID=UPI002AD24916|nr:energy transducer TonB [Frankia sp. Cr1]